MSRAEFRGFFTLRSDGERFSPDPASWHGGAAVAGGVGRLSQQPNVITEAGIQTPYV